MKRIRIDNNEYNKSSEELAIFLLGKILCIKTKGPTYYRWRIVETEAYSSNKGGDTKCRTGKEYKSVGKLIFDGGNGMNITSTDDSCCDNVLIRGAITAFCSRPYKLMNAISFREVAIINKVVDLTKDDSIIYIEDDGYKVDLENLKGKPRINADGPNWNYSIELIGDLLKGLN